MKKLFSSLCAAAIAASMAALPVPQAAAGPLAVPAAPAVGPSAAESGRTEVGHRGWRRYHGPVFRGGPRGGRPHFDQNNQWRYGRQHGGPYVYWNGHRGYKHRRKGYRYRDGYWFPPAAFIAGAIISGAIANSRSWDRHVRWCDRRYRSYRVSDDTFQPYHGPRKRCNSPYN